MMHSQHSKSKISETFIGRLEGDFSAPQIKLSEDAALLVIVTPQMLSVLHRNWLTWNLPRTTPVAIMLIGVSKSDFIATTGMERVQVFEFPSRDARVRILIESVTEFARSQGRSRVVILPASACALPNATLWPECRDNEVIVHCSRLAIEEKLISGNKFIPREIVASIPMSCIGSLSEFSSHADGTIETLSEFFFAWLESSEKNEGIVVRLSDTTQSGWLIAGDYAFVIVESPPITDQIHSICRGEDGISKLADDVVVISLPERIDRQKRIAEMMAKEKLWFRFVDGVRVKDEEIEPFEIAEVGEQDFKTVAGFAKYLRGMVGCRRAHLRELESAKMRGLKSLLIMEDDCVLEPNWRSKLDAALADLPPGWLQLYFSAADFRTASYVSTNLRRLTGAYQTTAILYSEAGITAALNCLRCSRSEIDHWMGNHLHPFGNSYSVYRRIASQQGGVSDIMSVDRGITA